jgi:peptidoglycan LD-endopeptidase CwlK
MPRYSQKSKDKLASCDTRIQRVFNEVIKHFDCTITCGHRTQQEQDALFYADPPRTQVKWPNGKHNTRPSKAVDVVPYPIDWEDRERFTYFAGFVMGIAKVMGIGLRWGGDWDNDTEVDDNKFDDLPHFELIDD